MEDAPNRRRQRRIGPTRCAGEELPGRSGRTHIGGTRNGSVANYQVPGSLARNCLLTSYCQTVFEHGHRLG